MFRFVVLSCWWGWVHFSVVFFFKQKTAYEMRISDWSSDVCSSDLPDELVTLLRGAICGVTGRCHHRDEWTEKPHGRRAKTLLIWCGESTADLDLSVMPAVEPKEKD